jgi:hypothetical protein
MEKISHKNFLVAIRVKRLKNGAIPLTEPGDPLQVLTHKRKAGKKTPAHFHLPKKRITQSLQECLIMIKGRIKVDLYGTHKKRIKSLYLSAGDIVIFMGGGHAVHILEDTELIEVKNGPFIEDRVMIE